MAGTKSRGERRATGKSGDGRKAGTHARDVPDATERVPYGDDPDGTGTFIDEGDLAREDDLELGEDLPERIGGAGCDVAALTSKELGDLGELIAACYLEERGYDILEHNYRCAEGEADLIAYDGSAETVVLVEVKTRRVRAYSDTYPEEAVDRRKRTRYRRIASCYLMDRFPVMSMRFDVVSVQVRGDNEAQVNHFIDVFEWEAER